MLQNQKIVWMVPGIPAFFVAIDFMFPLPDFAYSVFFIPGLVLAFMGKFYSRVLHRTLQTTKKVVMLLKYFLCQSILLK